MGTESRGRERQVQRHCLVQVSYCESDTPASGFNRDSFTTQAPVALGQARPDAEVG